MSEFIAINYKAVYQDLRLLLGEKAVSNEYHRRFAWSTDASYFRIVPEIVVHANNTDEVKHCLSVAQKHSAPITFRASGSSLSGQAIGEGILLILGFDGFRKIEINQDASKISLGVAVIGSEANAALKPFNKKIGPDPATLEVAKIGGIVCNNSSGMCCGTLQNSYQTIVSAKLIFADGTLLDTASDQSKLAFQQSHYAFLQKLTQLAEQSKSNAELKARIKKKYAIKNTTGYSLNALIDFSDPFDIINHLIVGSEGTLAFVEEVTYQSVEDALFKASALAVFSSIKDAALAIPILQTQNVAAVELLDFASIKAITGKAGMPSWLSELPLHSALLLIETRANDKHSLENNIQNIINALSSINTIHPMAFTDDAKIYNQYWAMRTALFPIVAGNRKAGTLVIIEDIAFQTCDLANAAEDLTALFQKHGYPEGVIFGHALAGNLHFIVTPAFHTKADIKQFGAFMQDVSDMVLNKYQGSMKAEHGTGRAVAPFVEMEWGQNAYKLMQQIKALFDPNYLLNPGVILNNDKRIHLKNTKSNTPVDKLVDKCIDCGFCEKSCPTSALSMSPRQRIATLREIGKLNAKAEFKAADALQKKAKYDLIDTCISCQLCNIACPVDIGMGELAHKLRAPYISLLEQKKLDFQAKHFAKTNQVIRTGLNLLNVVHQAAGSSITRSIINTARKLNKDIPNWNPSFPTGGQFSKNTYLNNGQRSVVYFPACGGRLFGATPKDQDNKTLCDVVETLLKRAGFNIIKPKNLDELCCGQLWLSKGDKKNAKTKHQQLINEIIKASNFGKIPVLIDALSCTYQTLNAAPSIKDKIEICDLVDFIHDHLLDKLRINIKKSAVTLHLGCSAQKLNREPKMQAIVEACADEIIYPKGISCCGFAGEKGMYLPEISASALRNINNLIPDHVKEGYYANRMCELGLSQHSNVSYRHLAYLVEECTRS